MSNPQSSQTAYDDPRIIAEYAQDPELQPAEETLLAQLRPALGEMDMLDVGVGAGRTTRHFAPLARSYLGLDYAQGMIERCKAEFPAFQFAVADARELEMVKSETYDFVLFSYNGIDSVEVHDRIHVLREMKRVLRPGGLMAFSSHNTNFLPEIMNRFRFRTSATPRKTLGLFKRATLFNVLNPTLRFRVPLAVGHVHDGTHGFRSSVCYISPDFQIEELCRLEMREIWCAPCDGDRYLPDGDARIKTFLSPWIYYTCRKAKM